MRVSVDWELLSRILGFSHLTREMWSRMMEDFNEEQKSAFVEEYIRAYILNGSIEINVEDE